MVIPSPHIIRAHPIIITIGILDLLMLWRWYGNRKDLKDSILVPTILNVGYKVNVKAIPLFHALFFPIYEGTK